MSFQSKQFYEIQLLQLKQQNDQLKSQVEQLLLEREQLNVSKQQMNGFNSKPVENQQKLPQLPTIKFCINNNQMFQPLQLKKPPQLITTVQPQLPRLSTGVPNMN